MEPKMEPVEIKKRNQEVVKFEKDKIVNAIFMASKEVGSPDMELARRMAENVVSELSGTPTVEQVQDKVEELLMSQGHSRIAKAYILHRQKRKELRKEKAMVLEKEELDEVDKRFDVNALRVLKARYLRKNEDKKLIETPKQLFIRVNLHAALPDLFYDSEIFDLNAQQDIHSQEEFDWEASGGKYKIGKYTLNKYHMKALKMIYDRFNKGRMIKASWTKMLELISQGYFDKYEKNVDEFYNLMTHRQFIANTPAMANFGNPLGMGSACFVMDVKDSIEDIMETLKQTAIVFKAGGGMGYNFSKLRPEGDFVSTTGGVASGPLSFMKLFDAMTEVIKQGGIRRGANMGILNSNHPDIEKFITMKAGNKAMTNFNISVLIMPEFWECYEKNEPYPLVNPKTGKVVKTVSPRELFDKIVYQAWESAEPGVIFFDRVNKYNPFFEHLGPIVTTNPCGEVLLYPYESCNLGSINVWKFLKEDENHKVYMDWDGLARAVRLATRFLDNVIEVNHYPLKQIEFMALATRKIGLGVMGVADLLYELEIPYNSEEGRKFMERLMEFINYHSKLESIELAKSRGNLPYYNKSFYPEGRLPFAGFDSRKDWSLDWDKVSESIKKYGIRNGYTTVIAPTGSISMIAGCSSGMEPNYSLVFEKNVKVGSFFYTNHVFEKMLKKYGIYSEEIMKKVSNNGGRAHNIEDIPERLRRIFVTAMDITPEDHIRALAAFQKWTDSSISKTNNFPADATVEHMRDSYLLAYKLGCKDVTVFRDSSIKNQVLNAPNKNEVKAEETPKAEVRTDLSIANMTTASAAEGQVQVLVQSAGEEPKATNEAMRSESKLTEGQPKFGARASLTNCPECKVSLEKKEGCVACPSCGWGLCS